jgi:transposase
MTKMEDWVTIKNLKKKNPTLGTRRIARQLGFSRNTVRRALSSDRFPEYKRVEQSNPDIEPYKDVIREMLMVKKLIGSRILEEIISKGYKGSKSAFYRYLSTIKGIEKRCYKPYETSPGEQAQYDWSEYKIEINGEKVKAYVFIYILGFSRYKVYEGSLSQTQSSILSALENSFIKTGGVPERIQTDNAGSFIVNASVSNFEWNKEYLNFCGYYGVMPTRSLPSHPWSKGKVENPFDYLEDHFIEGNTFSDFPDFLKRLEEFEVKVNGMIHSTTKKIPLELFEVEKYRLLSLPVNRYTSVKEEIRKVTSDCLISYGGNRYSVPYQHSGGEVWVKVSKGYILNIYSSKNELIATHQLNTGKGNVIMNEEHYRGYRANGGNWNRLSQMFLERFPNQQTFLDKLKVQNKGNPAYYLSKILDIIKFYNDDDVQRTIEACFMYDTFTHTFIQKYLEINYKTQVEVKPLLINLSHNTQISIKRDLNDYKL